MLKQYGNFISLALIILGSLLIFQSTRKTIILVVDGETRVIQTYARTVNAILKGAEISIGAADRIIPSLSKPIRNEHIIQVDHAAIVHLLNISSGLENPLQNQPLTFFSVEKIPANILLQVGIRLFPGDRILWNGVQVDLDSPLPISNTYTFQFMPAIPLTIQEDGYSRTIYSSAINIEQALWEAGIILTGGDHVSLPLSTPLEKNTSIYIKRSISLTIRVDGKDIAIQSSSATIGKALSNAGISLQNLDYSIPSEEQPLPADGIIQIVRVNEEVLLEQKALPFEISYQEDPETELDQQSIIQEGQTGLQVSRLRIRYENSAETSRVTEAQWTAAEPQNRVIGYGTKIQIHTLETPNGTIEYWRAIPMYATSYSPCRSGTDTCYSGTSSGLPVKQGVVAVKYKWYLEMAGQQVYVPGYGKAVIADVGGGIPGKYWIDLGYSDDDYVAWYHNVTVYFLTPVPSSIPWILP